VTNGQLLAESGHELVIGGYVPGAHGLDSIIVGYYRGKELLYIALVGNGFVRRKDTIVPNVPRLHQNSALESAV
jgi:ATP-dependent DNA ligase